MWISGENSLCMLDHAIEGEQDTNTRGKKGAHELKVEMQVDMLRKGAGAKSRRGRGCIEI